MSSAKQTAELQYPFPTNFIHSQSPRACGLSTICDYIKTGLTLGEGILVIATFEHIEAIKAHLQNETNLNLQTALNKEQLVFVNANRALQKFMKDKTPVASLFAEVFIPLVKKMKFRFPSVRLYGEMPALLWSQKRAEAAITIQNYWRELSVEFKINCLWCDPLAIDSNAKHLADLQNQWNAANAERDLRLAREAELRALQLELNSTRDSLEAARQTKAHFASTLSYEIREPLTAIIGFAEMLSEADISDENKTLYLQKIVANGKRLAHASDELLSFSKHNPMVSTRRTAIHFHQWLRDLEMEMKTEVEAKKLNFNPRWEGKIPEIISCDPSILRQVLMRLVRHSLGSTARGELDFTVTARKDPNTGSPKLVFYVRDTGAGFKPEEASKIFSPTAAKENENDSNFGLFFTRFQARTIGGDIQLVCSNPGAGSLFKFVLRNYEP